MRPGVQQKATRHGLNGVKRGWNASLESYEEDTMIFETFGVKNGILEVPRGPKRRLEEVRRGGILLEIYELLCTNDLLGRIWRCDCPTSMGKCFKI